MANVIRIEKCLYCGNDNPPNRRQFCCDRCQRMYRSEQRRRPRICEACGKEFFADYNQRYRKYCSEECRKWGQEQARIKQKAHISEKRFRQKAHTTKNRLLEADAMAAKEAGLTYGQYQALKFMRKEVVINGR